MTSTDISYFKMIEEAIHNKGENEMSKQNRMKLESKPLPFSTVKTETIYYQVAVGAYGVVLPDALNFTTLNGLTLIEGKASVINEKGLASRIAIKTGGKLLAVTESFKREIEEVKELEVEMNFGDINELSK